MPKKAVFLDRDGVLNHAPVIEGRPNSPKSVSELTILKSAIEACQKIKSAGHMLIAVTNQPDIARGNISHKAVQDINDFVFSALSLDDIRTCPHDNNDHCSCRKPKPGLLIAAALEHKVDLNQSIMVGDRWADIEAGRSAGCKTVFIDYVYKEQRPTNADFNCASLLEAAPWIIETLRS